MEQRYSTAGLAHSAADRLTEETGRTHRMSFRPRSFPDTCPFVVVNFEDGRGQGWIGVRAGGEIHGTQIERVAQIWADQGIVVLALPTTVDDLNEAFERLKRARQEHHADVQQSVVVSADSTTADLVDAVKACAFRARGVPPGGGVMVADKAIHALRDGLERGATGAERTAPSPADRIISEIEERFPDWRSYRDLIDCIDCTLHALRERRG